MYNLSEYDLTLLRIIEKGRGRLSWYGIGMSLSNFDFPERPDMMATLKRLSDIGLVRQYSEPDSGLDRWELTEAAKEVLASAQNPANRL